MPDSGSVTLQLTVTLLVYQPFAPAVPVTVGTITDGRDRWRIAQRYAAVPSADNGGHARQPLHRAGSAGVLWIMYILAIDDGIPAISQLAIAVRPPSRHRVVAHYRHAVFEPSGDDLDAREAANRHGSGAVRGRHIT